MAEPFELSTGHLSVFDRGDMLFNAGIQYFGGRALPDDSSIQHCCSATTTGHSFKLNFRSEF